MTSHYLSSESYEKRLQSQQQAADERFEHAQETGDQAALLEAHQMRQTVARIREGVRDSGIPLSRFRVLEGGQQADQQTLGVCELEAQQVGNVGLADPDAFAKTASSPEEIRDQARAVALHEVDGHQEANRKAEQRGEYRMVERILGEEDAVAIDEANAMAQEGSHPLSNNPPEYRAYSERAGTIASALKWSRRTLLSTFAKGEQAKIVQRALETGYLEEPEAEQAFAMAA